MNAKLIVLLVSCIAITKAAECPDDTGYDSDFNFQVRLGLEHAQPNQIPMILMTPALAGVPKDPMQTIDATSDQDTHTQQDSTSDDDSMQVTPLPKTYREQQ